VKKKIRRRKERKEKEEDVTRTYQSEIL